MTKEKRLIKLPSTSIYFKTIKQKLKCNMFEKSKDAVSAMRKNLYLAFL